MWNRFVRFLRSLFGSRKVSQGNPYRPSNLHAGRR
jgi:hypothetical protein